HDQGHRLRPLRIGHQSRVFHKFDFSRQRHHCSLQPDGQQCRCGQLQRNRGRHGQWRRHHHLGGGDRFGGDAGGRRDHQRAAAVGNAVPVDVLCQRGLALRGRALGASDKLCGHQHQYRRQQQCDLHRWRGRRRPEFLPRRASAESLTSVRRQWVLALLLLFAGCWALAKPGEELWHWTARAGIVASPAIGPDGTIYFGADDGYLYAVSSSGSNRWIFPMYQYLEASPAVGEDGTIYAGSQFGVFYAVAPNGTAKWEFTLNTGGPG